ncbi:MAG TPA: cobalamin biosynthesis protein CobN, partial [Phycisphaerae bacterium]|nr:cobalamin biosynthesis protein CobN [Phycisphaerae bacterium]
MKLAISGKGGVGKSTLAAALALLVARRGRRVL